MYSCFSPRCFGDNSPSLFQVFKEKLELKAKCVGLPGTSSCQMDEALAASMALAFVCEHSAHVETALTSFGLDGRLANGKPMPASAYNDFYKWTMCPVTYATHKSQTGGVRCSFSVNVRDAAYRRALVESATGVAGPQLLDVLRQELESLASRPFDRETFERCVVDMKLEGWTPELIDYVCGTKSQCRNLADEVIVNPTDSSPREPSSPDGVMVQLFVAKDSKLNEERVYVEATGPWPRVTWLETSMMQSVYEALFRDRNRKRYLEDDEDWYPKWLAEAFVRCVRSTNAAIQSGLLGALFTGRRCGGMALMMLQCMYIQKSFRGPDGLSRLLGTSSVTAHYWMKNAGIPESLIPKPSGTHAHELSMTLSAVLGQLDDEVGMPLSQVVGHMAYFFLSQPNGNVLDPERKSLMPMLPDTLGTSAFMTIANELTIPQGVHKGQPVLSVMGAARQDSGTLKDFADLMKKYQYSGLIMASEIDVPDDMNTAASLGYKLFGAGGFFGDSEHAWDKNVKNISMAVKVLRVHVGGQPSPYFPVKTGDDTTGGKFEADGMLDEARLKDVKARTEVMRKCQSKVNRAQLQSLFEQHLTAIIGVEG